MAKKKKTKLSVHALASLSKAASEEMAHGPWKNCAQAESQLVQLARQLDFKKIALKDATAGLIAAEEDAKGHKELIAILTNEHRALQAALNAEALLVKPE